MNIEQTLERNVQIGAPIGWYPDYVIYRTVQRLRQRPAATTSRLPLPLRPLQHFAPE